MSTPTPTHDARDAPRRPAWVDPLTNKGTAYRHDERRRLGLDGLLPPAVESLDVQSARVLHNVRTLADPLERYRYLGAIQRENETLFYHTLADHLEELLPIVYTPTVGQASVEWSRIYEGPRGLYVSAAHHRGRIAEVLRRWPRAPAFRLLHRYRQRLCCFNDDIQGTGAMGLAGVYASARATRTPLVEQRLLFVGAGEACLGIGALVVAAMQREGMSESDAKRHCLFVDSKGVVVQSRDDLADHKRPFAQDRPRRDEPARDHRGLHPDSSGGSEWIRWAVHAASPRAHGPPE